MVPEVGIAPTSPRLQRGANLPQLTGGRSRRLWGSGRENVLKEAVRSASVGLRHLKAQIAATEGISIA